MKTILFCLLVVLALFTQTEALRVKSKSMARATSATAARKNDGGPINHCYTQNFCKIVDVPNWGEEEICQQLIVCLVPK